MRKLASLAVLPFAIPFALAQGEASVAHLFEAANFIIALACIILAFLIVRHTGKLLGKAFIYITASIFIFGAIRFFIFLSEGIEIVMLHDTTIMLWWHFLFYAAVAAFITGLLALKSYDNMSRDILDRSTVTALVIYALLVIALFATAIPLDGHVDALFAGTHLDSSGAIHLIAFLLIGVAWTLLLSLRSSFGKTITSAVGPFLSGLAGYGLVHLWELLTESWMIIPVDHVIIELVESVLTLEALVAFLVAIWMIKRAIPRTN